MTTSRRLDTVVRVRRLQERLASAEVARRQLSLRTAHERELVAWDTVAARVEGHTTGLEQLRGQRTMLQNGIAHAEGLGVQRTRAAGEVATAIDSWRVASQRLDGVERLSERLVSTERFEAERAEYAELDDLVVMRWDREAAS